MKAARLHHPRGPLQIDEIEEPEPGPGEVLIRTEACGLCHSDLFIGSLAELPRTPLTLGHEAIGTIEKLGTEDDQIAQGAPLAQGDRVAVTFLHAACGACESCRASRPELCAKQVHTGYHVDGAFAEYVVARAAFLAKVPSGLDAVEAAPLCCAGWTAYHAVITAGLAAGDWLAIFGIGGLGQLGIQFARLAGLRVAAIDIAPEKLAIAKTLGAELTIDATTDNPAKALKKSIQGTHAAISFVASAGAIRGAFNSLRRGGTLVLVGLETESFELPLVDVVLKAIRIQGSFLGRQEELQTIFALASERKIQLQTESCALEDLPKMIERMETGKLKGRAVVRFQPLVDSPSTTNNKRPTETSAA
jgi:propanol-preferring alcohol dehydrogenase